MTIGVTALVERYDHVRLVNLALTRVREAAANDNRRCHMFEVSRRIQRKYFRI